MEIAEFIFLEVFPRPIVVIVTTVITEILYIIITVDVTFYMGGRGKTESVIN